MAVEFFSANPVEVDRRLTAYFDAAEDVNGEPLFPDHTVPGTPGYNLRLLWRKLLIEHYRDANELMTDMSPRTAEGLGLDGWADFFSMPRTSGAPATGRIVFAAEQTGAVLQTLLGTNQIGAGTRLVATGVLARVVDLVEFPRDKRSVEGRIEIEAGSLLNSLPVGSRLQLSGNHPLKAVVTIESVTPVGGARTGESDAQLRARLRGALRAPASFEGFLTSLYGHTDVDEVELGPAKYGPGTVEAYVQPAVSFPPATLRSELEALYTGPGRAYVVFPEYEALALRIRVIGSPGKKAIVDYINNLEPGSGLVLSRVEAVLLAAGASDAEVVAIRRGGVDEDGDILDPRNVIATNLSPKGARTKLYTRSDWITFCN